MAFPRKSVMRVMRFIFVRVISWIVPVLSKKPKAIYETTLINTNPRLLKEAILTFERKHL